MGKSLKEAAVTGLEKDSMRYANKLMLDSISVRYLDRVKEMTIPTDIPEEERQRQIEDGAAIVRIMNMVHEYANLDVTSVHSSDRNKEIRLYEDILHALSSLEDKLTDQEIKGLSTSENYDDFHRMTAGLLTYFEGQRDGCLEMIPGCKIVNAAGVDLGSDRTADHDLERKDEPIFPHDPSYNDIYQGEIGDCYLISSLSYVAMKHPEKIKEAIKDNGNGTVTVRFWERSIGPGGPGAGDTFTPVYVTVDKITPYHGSNKRALWVEMMERAYAASGLHPSKKPLLTGVSQYGRTMPSQKTLDDEYERLSKLDRFDLPSHEENPWLIDMKGNLKKYSPSYSDIAKGGSGLFVESFLGPDYQMEKFLTADLTKSSTQITARQLSYEFLFSGVMPEAHLDPYHNQKMRDQFNLQQISPADLIYRMVTKDPEARLPRNKKQEVVLTTPETAIAAAMDLAFAASFNEKFPNGRRSVCEKWNMTGTLACVNRVRNGEQIEPLASILRTYVDSNPDTKIEFDSFLEQFEKNAMEFSNDHRVSQHHSGEYNSIELKLWEKIRASLQAGYPVTVGSQPNSSLLKGLVSSHAYTVTGVEVRKNKDGKDLYFIRIRNPQGFRCRDYARNSDGDLIPQLTDNENGEGVIELGDALKDLAHITFNRPQEANHEFAPVQDPIDSRTLSKYYRAMESIKKDLDAGTVFSRNSKEYKRLVKAVDVFMKKDMYYLKGREMTELAKSLEVIDARVDDYVKHCNKTASKDGDVRQSRLQACASFKKLHSIAKTCAKDPRKAILDEMAKSLVSSAIIEEKIGQEQLHHLHGNMDSIEQTIKNSTQFKASYGKKAFSALAAANTNISARLKNLQKGSMEKQNAVENAPFIS